MYDRERFTFLSFFYLVGRSIHPYTSINTYIYMYNKRGVNVDIHVFITERVYLVFPSSFLFDPS